MTHVPHDICADFPEHVDRIRALRENDAHFARLDAEYADVNAQVHRAETRVEPMSDLAEEELRKRRAYLKDELYRMITSEVSA